MRPWKYVAAFILLLPASARADGIDTHLFRPALDSRGLVSVNGADVLPANHVSLGLTLDYGRNVATIRNSYTGTFHFDYGVADRAVVGASTPALLMNGD